MVAKRDQPVITLFMGGPEHFRTSLLAALLFAGAMTVEAQVPATPATHSPVHSISPEIVQAVTKKLPKYSPPSATKMPEVTASNETNDSPDILHLPKLTVNAAPPEKLSDYEVLTPKGRLDLAMQLHPGLRVGNIFGLNNGIALAMLAEERDVQKKAALKETVERYATDSVESKRMARLLKAAIQRPNGDWLTSLAH